MILITMAKWLKILGNVQARIDLNVIRHYEEQLRNGYPYVDFNKEQLVQHINELWAEIDNLIS